MSMTGGVLAGIFGPVLGSGPARGVALIFVAEAILGLGLTLIALRSPQYRTLSARYVAAEQPEHPGAPAAATHSAESAAP